jgi:neutral ceramidase
MTHRLASSLCLILLGVFSPAPALEAAESGWRAGVAKINITPQHLMWMSGYAARTKPAEGKLQDLWAKALVLEDPKGQRAVIVTMDLVGIPRDLSLAVCSELQERYHLPREAILLCVSHTHSGPVIRHNLDDMFELDETQRKLISDYTQALKAKLVAVVGEALRQVAPVQLAWGNGQAAFAVNRRNNKEADVPQLRSAGQLEGPVDHDLPVLSVRDAQGHLRAIVCGYACHATVLSDYLWSGDYPGFALMQLEQAYPGAVALFWAGCGGDQNPLPRRSVARAQEYGRQLADGVRAVLNSAMTPITGKFAAAYREIDLPFGELPTREQLVKESTAKNKALAARARHLLQRLDRGVLLPRSYPYPVQTWQLGPGLIFIALGGEVVVDYSLRLKKELGPRRTWVAGYCNDVMAYIPSLRVLKEGGYEGGGAMIYYGLPAAWGPRVEELIVAAVHEQVRELREGSPNSGERNGSRGSTHRR